tara:strand:+ start:314 stop:547 length:234 start_codon:yes stop_codon:yes gene_type:complete
MINELFSMNGYGLYVWSAFTFTLLSFGYLYFVTKTQLVKEQSKFLKKYSNLTHNKVNVFKEQRTLKEILAYSNTSKI